MAGLDATPGARWYWHAFPRSARRAILEWITNAKTSTTRQARIQRSAADAARNIRGQPVAAAHRTPAPQPGDPGRRGSVNLSRQIPPRAGRRPGTGQRRSTDRTFVYSHFGNAERGAGSLAADAAYMKTKPGFISAQLFRGIGGSRIFTNVAVWESAGQLHAAFGTPSSLAACSATRHHSRTRHHTISNQTRPAPESPGLGGEVAVL